MFVHLYITHIYIKARMFVHLYITHIYNIKERPALFTDVPALHLKRIVPAEEHAQVGMK